jgi:hypothetical protein
MYPIAPAQTRGTMPVVGGFSFLPPGPWNGARDESNELLEQIPGVNAPVAPFEQFTEAQTIADYEAGVKQQPWAKDDVTGLIDRQLAQRELRAKLNVIGPNHKGPTLPNQITEEELQHYALVYSNVRLGRGDLTIDASTSDDPEQYKRDMMDDIGDIMQTASGRQLIDTLANNTRGKDANGWIHRHTTLRPMLDEHGDVDATNANERSLGDINNPAEGYEARFKDGRPGVGTNTLVSINPNMDIQGSRSDVILFHEMVHALADTQGVQAWATVEESDRPGDANVAKDAAKHKPRTEHQAAGLGKFANDPITENAYRRERRALALSGKGMAGDLNMSQRENYTDNPEPYRPFFGL